MGVTRLTSRELNQDTSRAKKAARSGPVFITDRGRPAHVLLSIEDYQRLVGGERSLLDAVAAWDAGAFDFDPPSLDKELFRPADLGCCTCWTPIRSGRDALMPLRRLSMA